MMSIFYTRIVLFILLPITALSAVAIHVGTTQPIHPVLRGMVVGCENIPQPCWYGIVPNQTSLSEALTQIEALGFEIWLNEYTGSNRYYFEADSCLFSFFIPDVESPVESVTAEMCDDLRLGDLVTEFGTPRISRGGDCFEEPLYYLAFTFVGVELQFDSSINSMQTSVRNFTIDVFDSGLGVPWNIKQPYHRSRELPVTAPRGCGA